MLTHLFLCVYFDMNPAYVSTLNAQIVYTLTLNVNFWNSKSSRCVEYFNKGDITLHLLIKELLSLIYLNLVNR